MTSLYQLTGERLALARRLESLNLDDETIADTLEGESSALEAKIADYGFVIRNRRSFSDEIEAEIERLQARLKAERSRVAKIEAWLLSNMQACGITEIECPVFKISVKQNPESVVVLNEQEIPAEYMRVPEVKTPTAQPDKILIKAALKAQIDIPGCRLARTVKLEIK